MNIKIHLLPNTMIPARTAKEKTDEVIIKLATNILFEVFYGINQSISRGEYYYDHNFINVSDAQLKHAKDALEICGYVVSRKPGAFPRTFLRISWYNPR